MKYFYIDDIKYNYNFEFDISNTKNKWKLNAPLIEYFETLDILIPHYCYHKNLSIAGNCRMCLIELKKSPKPIVSCAMNAKSSLSANTEIYTNSPLVKKARENIMEFLLLNHPLDCPICDQGGECDLQDQSLFFGITKKRFYNFKRVVVNKNIGPIVKTVMTRCIHCTRCVRFATEIAGIEDLGIFGRGVTSEIGTYINKIFLSELSGNIIDLCPVGALTSKPYPFIGRSWELKSVNTIDLSDGFGLDIQIYLKNNKIIKILPGYNYEDKTMNWISDKTRFLFDGMFTPERKITKTIASGISNKIELSSWTGVFKDLIYTIYFYDHLNRHFFKINPITFVFDENTSLEVINLLQIIEKKFSFFNIRKSTNSNMCCDFESNLQITSITNSRLLDKADVCLLLGTNLRYEGYHLNLKLKKRAAKGNFKLFTFNNLNNFTFPTISLGNNIKTFKSLIEGNHSICQNIKEAKHFLIFVSSDIFKRNDNKSVINLLKSLKSNTTIQTSTWNGFNIVNNYLNSTGINLLNNFKNFKIHDLNSSNVIYFINTNFNKTKVTNFLDLKLLNYCNNLNENNYMRFTNKTILEQNSNISKLNTNKYKSNLNFYKYFYLPNNTFFEKAGSYINTEGIVKKSIKVISSKKNTKDDWQLIRKLYSKLNHIQFTSEVKCNNIIQFNCKNVLNFKHFTNFLYLNLTNKKNQSFYIKTNNFNVKKNVINNTLLKKNINDLYLNGFESYSKLSPTMIDCSKQLRNQKTNFN